MRPRPRPGVASAARSLAAVAGGSIAALGAVALASCIIADPPVEAPKPPLRRPTIIRESATPPSSRPLGELPPDGFKVPVEIADPTADFQWAMFIDYEPSLNTTNNPRLGDTVTGGQGHPDVLTIPFTISPDSIGAGCHRIEFMVALSFVSPHVADPAGADSITWFYTPNGSLDGCTVFEGGVGADGAFPPDAPPEASGDP